MDNHHFDRLDARCHDCGDVTAHVMATVCTLIFVIATTILGHAILTNVQHRLWILTKSAIVRIVRKFEVLGLRPKLKVNSRTTASMKPPSLLSRCAGVL